MRAQPKAMLNPFPSRKDLSNTTSPRAVQLPGLRLGVEYYIVLRDTASSISASMAVSAKPTNFRMHEDPLIK